MVYNFLIFVFLLFLPTQLGKYFWFDFSFVNGIRVDYLAVSVYFLDILAWLIILFGFKRIEWKKWKWWLLFVVLGVLTALNKQVALMGIVRMTLALMLMMVLKNNKKIKKYLSIVIPIWVVVEVFLSLGQIILGRSLGGIFYYLGERSFNINTISIAQISWWGRSLLRGYGTFSHPNSLGGFLVITAYLWQKYKKNYFWWIIWWFIVLGIFLTGSRTAIVVFLLFFVKYWSVLFLGLGYFLIQKGVFGGWDVFSWQKRVDLMTSSIKMFFHYPLFGVGWNNFLKQLPNFSKGRLIQPVHNIFLLILSQLGIINSFIFVKALKSLIKKINWKLFLLVGCLGFFDHYFLTLPQNIWILIISLVLG
jgi:hypothetical protein